ncbi:chitin deacetylase [Cladochytrium tenue]|nr:chitin deacetylase [Cladochytrium tenue]
MVTSTDATQTAISASPTTGAEDSSGSSTILSGTYIGVIAGVGSFLVLVAVLSVFVIRERRKSEREAAEIAAKIDRGEWGLNLDQDPVGQEQARMLEEARRAAAAAALAREKAAADAAAAEAAEAAARTAGPLSSASSLAGNWVGRWGSQSGPSPLRQTRAVPRAGGGGGGGGSRVLKSALKKRTSAELQAERERERLREMREQIRMSDDEGGAKTPPLQPTGGDATETDATTVAAAAEVSPLGPPRPGPDGGSDGGEALARETADIISADDGGADGARHRREDLAPDFTALNFPSGVSTMQSDGFFHPPEPPVIDYWTNTIESFASSHPIPNLTVTTAQPPWVYNASFDILSCPSKVWAVAVDDGPRGFTDQYLDLLANYSATGTFFILGGNLVVNSSWATQVRSAYDAGHQIALHSWSHRHMSSLATEDIISEFIWNALAVKQVIGKIPRFVRPPYGDIDDRVRSTFAAMGFIEIMWNTNPDDTSIVSSTGDVKPGTVTTAYTVANATAVINATLTNGYGPYFTFLPPNQGFIPLQHELIQEQIYFARDEMEMVSAAGYSFASVAYCQSGGLNDTDELRYFSDSEPFAQFLASIPIPFNLSNLDSVTGAWPNIVNKTSSALLRVVAGPDLGIFGLTFALLCATVLTIVL